MQVQKLVYISHGWYLGLTDGDPLVTNERVEAWEYGPVYPSVYYAFMKYGGGCIESYGKIGRIVGRLLNGKNKYEYEIPYISVCDFEVCKLLDRVWEVYGNFSGAVLSAKTHVPGSPWAQAKKAQQEKGEELLNGHISDNSIMEYYQELMKGE